MFKYEKQFRKENPQTIGETDSIFDLDNYKDWLEEKLQDFIDQSQTFIEAVDTEEIIIQENFDNDGYEGCASRMYLGFKKLINILN